MFQQLGRQVSRGVFVVGIVVCLAPGAAYLRAQAGSTDGQSEPKRATVSEVDATEQITLVDEIVTVPDSRPAADNPPAGASQVPLRDPTQPSPDMRAMLAPATAGVARLELPPLILKARLLGGRGPATAVLGLDQQLYPVHEGSELTLTDARWAGQQYRVVEISAEAVRLESVPHGRGWTLY